MLLTTNINELKGIGPAVAQKYAYLGVTTVSQLIDYYPKRYEDYSSIQKVDQIVPGSVTIEAIVKQAKGRYVKRGMHITEAVASDDSGSVRLVWFNQPYRLTALQSKHSYFISGIYQLSHQRFTIINPSIELASEFPVNTARIIPIYRETKGITSRQIRSAIKQVVPLIKSLQESLPAPIIEEHDLMSRNEAILAMHFPDSSDILDRARERLGFEEVFQLSLASLLNKIENQHEAALAIPFSRTLAQQFVKNLPFELTNAQRKVIWQIYLDLQKKEPMNRLVEGDVGSGKTVVATMASLMVLKKRMQIAFMAPTELLARQHAATISELLKPLGQKSTVGLLVGSLSKVEKNKVRAQIANGTIKFIIGTQALIQEQVDMHKLAFVIVDEQHRFGVEQRKTLMAKAGHMPHLLSLTATPIPRSLALTLYGEMDVSILDEKPIGRMPIITKIVSPNSIKLLHESIQQELINGRQMFVVCPLISDSSVLDAQSAEAVYKQLVEKDFKGWRIELLHGKLKNQEKTEIMSKFLNHSIDILVTTTVIEVGVDVPNAAIMMIKSPERFGLAQIHQLRGRVGRSSNQGYCYLMMSDSSAPSRRLRALESSNDGFKLAELDLQMRGPGAIYGASQHGELDLRVATLTDVGLISKARASAVKLIDHHEDLLQYTQLMSQVTRLRAVTNLN
jgi:ATP-dependent DNA helicase RecG